MDPKVKIALIKTGLTLDDIAEDIDRSKTLVSLILNGKHKGYEHRRRIRQLLSLKEGDLPDSKTANKRSNGKPKNQS